MSDILYCHIHKGRAINILKSKENVFKFFSSSKDFHSLLFVFSKPFNLVANH